MISGKRRDQAAADARSVARVRGACEGYRAAGVETVPVMYVLGLLDPQGLWSQEPQQCEVHRETVQVPAIAGDPITGCASVQPPGA